MSPAEVNADILILGGRADIWSVTHSAVLSISKNPIFNHSDYLMIKVGEIWGVGLLPLPFNGGTYRDDEFTNHWLCSKFLIHVHVDFGIIRW